MEKDARRSRTGLETGTTPVLHQTGAGARARSATPSSTASYRTPPEGERRPGAGTEGARGCVAARPTEQAAWSRRLDAVLGEDPGQAAQALAAMAPGPALAALVARAVGSVLVPVATLEEPLSLPDPEDTGLLTGGSTGTSADAPERSLRQNGARLAVGEPCEMDALLALGPSVLSELVAGCHRLVAWAQWAESVAAFALSRSPGLHGTEPTHSDRPARLVSAEEARWTTVGEISMRLGISARRAGQVLDRGTALADHAFAPTEAMARVGLLDQAKVDTLVDRLASVPRHVAEAVEATVLPRAARRTHQQLARDIDRALMTADPDRAEERRRHNETRRRVGRPRNAGEGVVSMTLILPSLDAFLLDSTLDAVASAARAAGDSRTRAQLRADALTGMALKTLADAQVHAADEALAVGTAEAETPYLRSRGAEEEGRARGSGGSVATARADHASLRARGSTRVVPGERTGGDDALLSDGVPVAGMLEGLTTVLDLAGPWWTPSGQPVPTAPPGVTVHVDLTVPLHVLVPGGASHVDAYPPGAPPAPPPGPQAGMPPARPPSGATPQCPHVGADGVHPSPRVHPGQIDPAQPPDVAGVGPVHPLTAAALAAAGTWRRLVTDPLSGTVLDVGRTRYRPPAALADLARARDRRCTCPGCDHPARTSDLDHVLAWADGGTTSLDNLATLCRTHHRLKHTPGWSLHREDDGALTWSTPSGARYRREPDGTIHHLPRRLGSTGTQMPSHVLDETVPLDVVHTLVRELATRPGHRWELPRSAVSAAPWRTTRARVGIRPAGAAEGRPTPSPARATGTGAAPGAWPDAGTEPVLGTGPAVAALDLFLDDIPPF